ncbi:MAG TPA: hypothetical protein VHR66_05830 [Gemmataceae bacterium]|jgi:hypothetical protein|nr:hypothetical protein [Gemmataceae bacterium]
MTPPPVRLAAIALDERITPATTVKATFYPTSQTLSILGTSQVDQLAVTQLATGEFVITGENGTTINGATIFQSQTGVNRLTFHLGYGADVIRFEGTERISVGSIRLGTGPGNDHVVLSAPLAVGQFQVLTGDGSDVVDVNTPQGPVSTLGDLSIQLGAGGDQVTFNGPYGLSASTVRINAGRGNDTANVMAPIDVDSFQVAANDGSDSITFDDSSSNRIQLGDLVVHTGDDKNSTSSLTVRDTDIAGMLSVTGGRAADTITLVGVVVSGLTKIDTGGGAVGDQVSIDDSTFNSSFRLLTQAGWDRVEIEQDINRPGQTLFKDRAYIGLNLGSDLLYLGRKNNASAQVVLTDPTDTYFYGGPGLDTVFLDNVVNADASPLLTKHFSFETKN